LSFKEVAGPGDREAGTADDGVESDVSGLEVEEGAETCKVPIAEGSCSDLARPSCSAMLPRTSRESSTGVVISSVFIWTSAGVVTGTSSSSTITIGAPSEPGSGTGAGAREVMRNLGVAEEPFRVDPCLKSRCTRLEDGARTFEAWHAGAGIGAGVGIAAAGGETSVGRTGDETGTGDA
jgi:hypothetical protein